MRADKCGGCDCVVVFVVVVMVAVVVVVAVVFMAVLYVPYSPARPPTHPPNRPSARKTSTYFNQRNVQWSMQSLYLFRWLVNGWVGCCAGRGNDDGDVAALTWWRMR